MQKDEIRTLAKEYPDLFGPDGEDIKLDHFNFRGGRGALQLTHLPSGISIRRDLSDYPVIKTRDEMLEELRAKVQEYLQKNK